MPKIYSKCHSKMREMHARGTPAAFAKSGAAAVAVMAMTMMM